MSDTRPLVFPMTAGDVVVSTGIVAINWKAAGSAELRVWEVTDVEHVGARSEGETDVVNLVRIHVKDTETDFDRVLELDYATPLLLTGIRRR